MVIFHCFRKAFGILLIAFCSTDFDLGVLIFLFDEELKYTEVITFVFVNPALRPKAHCSFTADARDQFYWSTE